MDPHKSLVLVMVLVLMLMTMMILGKRLLVPVLQKTQSRMVMAPLPALDLHRSLLVSLHVPVHLLRRVGLWNSWMVVMVVERRLEMLAPLLLVMVMVVLLVLVLVLMVVHGWGMVKQVVRMRKVLVGVPQVWLMMHNMCLRQVNMHAILHELLGTLPLLTFLFNLPLPVLLLLLPFLIRYGEGRCLARVLSHRIRLFNIHVRLFCVIHTHSLLRMYPLVVQQFAPSPLMEPSSWRRACHHPTTGITMVNLIPKLSDGANRQQIRM